MHSGITAILFACVASSLCFSQTRSTAAAAIVSSERPVYASGHEFDPRRDASADIKAAVAEAQRTRRRIIVYVGGNWCMYCGQLGELFHRNPDLARLRDASFVTVYVYYGPENYNKKALSGFGKILGVPHYFVLESTGSLLHSQHLLDLRANGDYSAAEMKKFLSRWEPQAQTAQLPSARAEGH